MHKFHKLLMTSTAIAALVSLPLGQKVVQAQEAAIIQCMEQYTKLGISKDAAFAKCKKINLADCVKNLIAQKYVVQSFSKSEGRYVIDLGDNGMRWLEGPKWEEKGCKAKTDSSSFSGRKADLNTAEWFRQGLCSEPQIELEHNYSIHQAKTFCELGLQPQELSPLINKQNRTLD